MHVPPNYVPPNAEKTLTIGRSRDCDIIFDDGTVSRRHATLTFLADGRLLLADCGSTHGTKLVMRDGAHRIRSQLVSPTEVVEFGRLRVPMKDLLEAARLRILSVPPPPCSPPPPEAPPEPPKQERAHGRKLVRCECGAVKAPGTRCKECGQ